jgi:hypothetical protein
MICSSRKLPSVAQNDRHLVSTTPIRRHFDSQFPCSCLQSLDSFIFLNCPLVLNDRRFGVLLG